MSKPKSIMIDEVKYVREDSVSAIADKLDGLRYCVIRTYSAGVHIGYARELEGQQLELVNSRRLYSWTNAATLSQIAMDGCKSDKFTMVLPEIRLTDVIEIIPCSKKAKDVLESIKVWKI